MYRIGVFSKFCRVPVKTLRYYDEIGLFKPAQVDQFSGYRYYSADQLPRLYRILALKDLGFALDQIGQLLDSGLTPEQMRAIWRMKQAEQQERVRLEQERLVRVEWNLRRIEQEGMMSSYDVTIKQVEAQLVAGLRSVIPTYADIGGLYGELYAYLGPQGEAGGLCGAVYYDGEYRERDVDAEAVVFISRPLPDAGRVQIRELPAATVASTIHKGGYSGLSGAYQALMQWIEANQYQISGPEREIYLQGPAEDNMQDDPNCVTEIQFPVEPVS
jgi:effector-binding domain-containing protein